MDDHTRTRKTLDDLAELYLTGITSLEPSPPQQESSAHPKPPINASLAASHEQPDEPDTAQPPHLLYEPKLTITHPFTEEPQADPPQQPLENDHAARQQGQDAEQQPDLALALASIAASRQAAKEGQDQQPEEDLPAGKSPTWVEAVFLGNLPGFSGPWLTQYAHYQACRHGVMAVLSVDVEGVDIELVGPTSQPLDGVVERYTQSTEGSDSLAQALRFLAQESGVEIGGWIVHFSAPIDLEVKRRAQQINRWTLLCGADDAAVVGVYRLLKQLTVQRTPSSEGDINAHTDRQIGVMVMGSDESSGRAAAMKLNHTTGNFLNTSVDLVGCQKQMQPVNAQPLGYFYSEGDSDVWSLLHSFLETVETRQPEEAGDRPLPEEAQPAQPEKPRLEEEFDPLEEALDEPEMADDRVDLSTFMPSGFVSLEARCPRCDDAHLMLDDQGRVHVLLRAEGDSTAQTDESLGVAVADLQAVGKWVRQHMALLKLTRPGDLFDDLADPVLHLFTDQPKAATALVGRLESLVKVHLLQQVHVGAASTWHSCELN